MGAGHQQGHFQFWGSSFTQLLDPAAGPSCIRMGIVLLFLASQELLLQVCSPVGAVSQWTAVSRVKVADFSIWMVAKLVPVSVFPSLLGTGRRMWNTSGMLHRLQRKDAALDAHPWCPPSMAKQTQSDTSPFPYWASLELREAWQHLRMRS